MCWCFSYCRRPPKRYSIQIKYLQRFEITVKSYIELLFSDDSNGIYEIDITVGVRCTNNQ